jgi:hypothetical protein
MGCTVALDFQSVQDRDAATVKRIPNVRVPPIADIPVVFAFSLAALDCFWN